MTRRNQKGFLLVEVLVTLAVLSFGITAIVASIHHSLIVARQSNNYFTAANKLGAKLFELRTKGEIAYDDPDGFKYRMEKTALSGLPLYKVRLAAMWSEKGVEKEIWVNTYLAKK